MHRRQRTVVAGIHGLQHVERLFAAHLADDDAVGAHTQCVYDELPLSDGAFAFDVRRARLEPRDVLLVQLQFGRVFDRDDALAVADESGEHVQERRIAGAGLVADSVPEREYQETVNKARALIAALEVAHNAANGAAPSPGPVRRPRRLRRVRGN